LVSADVFENENHHERRNRYCDDDEQVLADPQ